MKTTIDLKLSLSTEDSQDHEFVVVVRGRIESKAAFANLFPVALALLHHAGAPPLPIEILDDPEEPQ